MLFFQLPHKEITLVINSYFYHYPLSIMKNNRLFVVCAICLGRVFGVFAQSHILTSEIKRVDSLATSSKPFQALLLVDSLLKGTNPAPNLAEVKALTLSKAKATNEVERYDALIKYADVLLKQYPDDGLYAAKIRIEKALAFEIVGQLDECFIELSTAKKQLTGYENTAYYAVYLTRLASYHRIRGNLEQARTNFWASKELADKFGMVRESDMALSLFLSLSDKADTTFIRQQRFYLLRRAQKRNDVFLTVVAYGNIAHYFADQKAFAQALNYCDSAISVSKAKDFPFQSSRLSSYYKLKSRVFHDSGKLDSAYVYLLQYVEENEKVKMLKHNEEVLGIEYDFKTQESVQDLATKTTLNEKLVDTNTLLWASLGLLTVFVGIISYLLHNLWLSQKKFAEQNIALQALNGNLATAVAQRELLLKEVHHRVKNNLQTITSLLELQSAKSSDEGTKNALLEGQNRVQSIALIHHKLYAEDNFGAVELHDFITDLYRQIAMLFTNKNFNISLEINVPTTQIDIDTAVPLGLILNELLTNAFKYAFIENGKTNENQLAIGLICTPAGNYTLSFADNGKGLPPSFDIAKSKSLGMRLITHLAKQIGGSSTYTYQNGSLFEVAFIPTALRKQQN